MEDFFKQFKENMENRPEPPFEERDWKDMENRLDRQGKRPFAFAWWWFALPLLLLLMASNVFFFLEWRKASRQSNVVERIQDTIYQTRVVYVTDTIYQTRTVHEKILENPVRYSIPEFLFSPLVLTDNGSSTSDQTGAFLPLGKIWPQERGERLAGTADSPALTVRPADISKVRDLPLKTLPYKQAGISRQPVDIQPSQSKKTLRHYLYAMRPKEAKLGFQAGWAYPFKKGLNGISGYSAGLEAAVDFSRNLRLWADAAYSNVMFSSARMDDAVGIPAVDPPGPEFVFVTAEVPQPSLQYSIGLQYFLNEKWPFKPYIGIGWGAVSMFPYEITYDFRDNANGIEWIFEKEVNNRDLLTGLLFLRIGIEHDLSAKWRWSVRATYRNKMDNMGLKAPNMLGLQAGLIRRF